jgi:hypothetical protein
MAICQGVKAELVIGTKGEQDVPLKGVRILALPSGLRWPSVEQRGYN